MTTTTVSIGSNQSIATVTPASSSGSNPYVLTFTASVSANAAVGDIFVIEDEVSFMATYTFLLTEISGSNYTLKQVSDGGSGMGDQSPYGNFMVYDDEFNPVQASGIFKRAFSTITLFEAMVDDASPTYWGSSDDVVGECHADSNFTDNTVNFSQKQSLSSVKLTVNSDDRHDGTAESGVLWKPTSGSGHDQGILRVAIDSFTVEWLDISMASLDSTNTNKAIVLTGTNDDCIIRNMLIHDKFGNPGSNGPKGVHVIGAGASSDTLTIQNNIIYELVETSNDSASAINVNQWAGISNLYNNTIYKITCAGSSKAAAGVAFGNVSSAVVNIKNNIVSLLTVVGVSSLARAYTKTAGGSTANTANNLSDDTTFAANNAEDMDQSLNDASALIGKTLAQIDFVSTVVGSEDLHIDTDSVCREAGVDLGTTLEVNIDIDGVDRDATGVTWDIGADQASVATVTVSGAASLTGTALVASAATRRQFGVSSLTGTASVASAATRRQLGVASLTGTASVASVATRRQLGVASLTGTASITTAATRKQFGVSSCSASASVSSVGTPRRFGETSCSATATMSTVGTRRRLGVVSCSATATVSTVGTRVRMAAASLSASATVSTVGTRRRLGATSCSASATMSTVGTRRQLGAVSCSATATMSTIGIRRQFGVAPLSATATLAATGSVGGTISGAASLNAAATVATAGKVKRFGASAITATAVLSSLSTVKKLGSAAISATASLAAEGSVGGAVSGAASLNATATITVTPLVKRGGASAISCSGTVTTSGSVKRYGASGISASAQTSVSGTIKKLGGSSLSASGVLSASGSCVRGGVAPLLATATLIAAGGTGGVVTGATSLSASATLDALGKIDQFPVAVEFIVYINRDDEYEANINTSVPYEASIETFREFVG